ncbi:9694_t:CDS:2 [Entrophospora sp. SA101]|nr:9694_t:CDS:2 [Entrophospora sp. SA101]
MNNIAESAINLFDKLLVTSLQMTIENDVIKYQKDFDASTIYRKIMKCVEHECNYSPGTPNKDAGVKFIKGFINGNAIDEDNMKSLISAAQTKHERIGVLFSEYLNDATTPHGTGAIKTHKETIWDLFNHLLDTLNVADNRALECNLWKIKTLCIESYWKVQNFKHNEKHWENLLDHENFKACYSDKIEFVENHLEIVKQKESQNRSNDLEDYSVGSEAFYLDLGESFSRRTPKWIERSKANVELMHSSVCKTARNSFIFIGGTYKNNHNPERENPLIEYNHEYDIWLLPYTEEPFDWRINTQCVSDNKGTAYIFSGYTQFIPTNNIMHILDTVNMIWSTGSIENAPSYRHGYTSTMLSNGLIVYIGGCNDSESVLNTAHASCEWSTPKISNNADTPPLLYGHSATSIDKYMIVAFGKKIKNPRNGSFPNIVATLNVIGVLGLHVKCTWSYEKNKNILLMLLEEVFVHDPLILDL